MKRSRVLLPASTPLSYAVVAPIARELARDPSIEIVVSARHGGEAGARECLDFPFRWRPLWLSRFLPFDVALCPGFFFGSVSGSGRRRGSLRGQIVQTFHGVSPKNYAVAKDVRRFDRLYLIGEYHRRKFERAGLLLPDDPRAISVGMPKTDPLARGDGDRRAVATALDLDPSLPIVAYAPTRSGSHGSSVDSMGRELLDALAELPVNVVVKLHDRSQRRFRRKLPFDHATAIEAYGPRSRVRLYPGHDVIPLLAAADVLVSDLSSVTGEFLLRDRPVVFAVVPRHEKKLRKSGARRFGGDDPFDLDWLRAAGETAEGALGVRAAVERALSDPTARSDVRRDRAEVLFYNPGAATPVAVRETRRLLGREPAG